MTDAEREAVSGLTVTSTYNWQTVIKVTLLWLALPIILAFNLRLMKENRDFWREETVYQRKENAEQVAMICALRMADSAHTASDSLLQYRRHPECLR